MAQRTLVVQVQRDERARLAAISRFTALGSGFHIAMRDLEKYVDPEIVPSDAFGGASSLSLRLSSISAILSDAAVSSLNVLAMDSSIVFDMSVGGQLNVNGAAFRNCGNDFGISDPEVAVFKFKGGGGAGVVTTAGGGVTWHVTRDRKNKVAFVALNRAFSLLPEAGPLPETLPVQPEIPASSLTGTLDRRRLEIQGRCEIEDAIYAARPVDPTHTYGHDKIAYFSSGLEGMLILVAAGHTSGDKSGDDYGCSQGNAYPVPRGRPFAHKLDYASDRDDARQSAKAVARAYKVQFSAGQLTNAAYNMQLGEAHLGDLIDVKDGFARNFLLPRKKAVLANDRSIKSFEHSKRVAAERAKKEKLEIEAQAKKISTVTLTVEAQVGKDDKMFGSVTVKDIAEGLAAQGYTVDRRKIQLPHPIKELGTFTIPVKMPRDVTAAVTVRVIKKQDAETATA